MMRAWCGLSCVFVVILLHIATAQLPPRPLTIPGAVLIQGARPAPLRTPRINADFGPPRPRRPQPSPIPPPLREVRPVVEEEEEESASPTSSFDAEVNKLGISALASAVRQASSDDLEEQTLRPSPLPFRPERPIPITRDQIRDRPIEASPRPIPRPLPVLRPLPSPVPRPVARQERPIVRQEIDDEEDLPIRQPARKARPQQSPPQQYRPAPPPRAPRPQYEDDGSRKRKPPVQILRKYRTDNPDGSITWGFENEDGTFKEETLGIDCMTRGKYGYVDPDGVRREYSYETGSKCDKQEEELEDEPLPPRIQPKKPLNIGKQQPQFRPPGSQY